MILAAGALVCCAPAPALDASLDISQYAHTSWKMRDGFSQGLIMAIAQGPDGYLWLGTEFGLSRFDGVRAVHWRPPAGQKLPSDNIKSLLFGHDGTLWIGTLGGLATWKDGKLTNYPEIAGSQIFSLMQDRGGTIWATIVGAPTGGNLCSIRNMRMECYGGRGSFAGTFGSYEDTQQNLWVGTAKGFWRWRPGPPKFFPAPTDLAGIRGFGEDEEHALLIGVKGGIRRFVNGRFEARSLPYRELTPFVQQIFRDHEGSLWIATVTHGLVHVHRGQIDTFSSSDGLSGDTVFSVLEDREGSVWVATNDGLDRFRTYSVSTISRKQGLGNTFPFSTLAASDGKVWIATANGLHRWAQGKISAYRTFDGDRTPGRTLDGQPGSLFEDSSGRIWTGNRGEFAYLDDDEFVIVHSFPSGWVRGIAEGSPGHLWVASEESGLLQVFRGKVVQRLSWPRLGFERYGNALVVDPAKKGLWIGFWKGGIAYFAQNKVQTSYSVSEGLGRGTVNDLRIDSGGALWAATDGGVSRIENGHISTLTSRNGLPCDVVFWTIEDNDHAVWLYMPCGLARVANEEFEAWAAGTKQTVKTRVLDASDGVGIHTWTRVYRPQVTKTQDGKIWFITSDGISVLDPHHIPINSLPPPVHIEQIMADNKPYSPATGLRLPSNVHNLTIEYTALSLVVPEKVRFRFKLEGVDPDWRDVVNDRKVQYSNLPPSHFRFRVIAANNSGIWNKRGDTLDFDISPAFYQTVWFRLLYVAAGGMLIWVVYRLRVRQMTARVRLRYTERLAERTRIARDLHDTLLQNLAGVTLQLDGVVKQVASHPEKAIPLIGQVREQVDASFQEARVKVWNLRSTSLEGPGLAVTLQQFCERIGPSTTADCEFHLLGQPRPLPADCEEELLRIAQEATHNAVRHAQSNQIRVVLEYAVKWLLLTIYDDGQGFDLQEGLRKADHWGLKSMQERAAQIHATCEITSLVGSGTRVQVHVPLPLKRRGLAIDDSSTGS